MEELLNKLIEKGWKPRGYNDIKKITVENNKNVKQKVIHLRPEIGVDTETLTRFICVKESGLWQFVCENDMADDGQRVFKLFDMRGYRHKTIFDDTCEYWLMLSALKDESELEQFLLDNIKVE